MQLDELLEELQTRMQAVLNARDGVHALLEAVVAIGRELDLQTVLRRIVEAATSLVDCKYGALGVIGEDGQLAQFVPVGVSDDEIARIAHWPEGHGILGMLVKDPQVLRLEELSSSPESFGFPSGHPPMHTFLGVPISIRDTVFGNLYLTEKRDGRPFDDQDELIVRALATAAGIAIENARLYDETRRRERWLDASGELTRGLLSGGGTSEAMSLLAVGIREMANAAISAVVVPTELGDELVVAALDSVDGGADLDGLHLPVDGTIIGSVFASGEPLAMASSSMHTDSAPLVSKLPGGPALLMPLGSPDRVRGVLVIGKAAGTAPFTSAVMRMLQQFCDQAGLVLELADARRRAEQVSLIDDRARIARDLHDVVIQRLFASAMSLTGAARLVADPPIAQRLEGVVDDLDVTIRQIRSTIFALQAREAHHLDSSLRARVMAITERAIGQLGFAPGLRLEGLLDTDIDDALVADAVAVVQELLANVVRHAHATQAEVLVGLADGNLTVSVQDNGVGIADTGRRSGLANLTERAERRGGSLVVGGGAGGGAVVTWQVPV